MWKKRNECDTECSQETLPYIRKYLCDHTRINAAPPRSCTQLIQPPVAHTDLLALLRRGDGNKRVKVAFKVGEQRRRRCGTAPIPASHCAFGTFTPQLARNINQPVAFQRIHSMLVTVTFHWLKAALSHWLLGQCGQASLGPNFSGALLLPRGGKAPKCVEQFQNDTTPLSSNATVHKGWFTRHNS